MRIWSLHPEHLDVKALVAVWRETLLAKNVLLGKTKGYRNHPQLIRFKQHPSPVRAVDFYLQHVFYEAEQRGYQFDRTKFEYVSSIDKISLTTGQLDYEKNHLIRKIRKRDVNWYHKFIKERAEIKAHPLFYVVQGGIEEWEKIG